MYFGLTRKPPWKWSRTGLFSSLVGGEMTSISSERPSTTLKTCVTDMIVCRSLRFIGMGDGAFIRCS